MEIVVSCPACGEVDSLDSKFDAWARYQIVGIDSLGNIELSSDLSVQTFDHNEIECSNCGKRFQEKEITSQLRSFNIEPET